MTLKSIGFAFGVAFGLVLGWARVTDYDVIHDMLLLRHPDVFLLMMSAMATAAVGVRVLRAFHARSILDHAPVTWTTQPPRARHLVGSVLFGMGWSVACSCPGPVAAQLGRGQLASLFTIAGLLTGILIHDVFVRGRSEPSTVTVPAREAVGIAGL
jgi:uncharacterized membrane protein YedE/YeeE